MSDSIRDALDAVKLFHIEMPQALKDDYREQHPDPEMRLVVIIADALGGFSDAGADLRDGESVSTMALTLAAGLLELGYTSET